MIPIKIEDIFIQLNTDLNGVILEIEAGKFAIGEFVLQDSIYNSCPFLEATLDSLPLNEMSVLKLCGVFSPRGP